MIVAARTEEGLGSFLIAGARRASRSRRWTRPARPRASCSTRRRPSRSVRCGDHTAAWRRVVDDGARDALRRARRRVRRRARARGRVREGARAVRPADRDVPGDPAQDRRHAAPARARPGRHALRGVGVRRRRPSARARRRDGEGLRRRGRGVRHRRGHPDARRRRLHVGLRRALLLQAGEAERRDARLPGLAAPAPRRPRPRRRRDADGVATGHAAAGRGRRARARRRRAAPRRSGTRAGPPRRARSCASGGAGIPASRS